MKKTLLFLSMLFVAVSAAFAQKPDKPRHHAFGPKEAYAMISKVQGLAPNESVTTIPITDNYSISGIKELKAENVDTQQINRIQDEIFRAINRVPLTSVVNGGTNGVSTGLVYSKPLPSGQNEVLIVAISAAGGYAQVDYGVADNATVEMIRNSAFNLDGTTVAMSVEQSSENYLINLSY